MSGAPAFSRLAWDSEFFGFGIGRIDAPCLSDATVADARAWAAANAVRCLYFLADAADAESTRAAERAGMAFTDIRLTFERGLRGRTHDTAAQIRAWRPDDLPALRAIARASHTDSRFYADPRFERARCDALYETWIERSCAGFAQAVLVAEDASGGALGYVSCHLRGETANLGLIAVAAEAQGQGIGPRLVEGFLSWAVRQNAAEATVVTQARNVRAQRLYQRAGFITKSTQLWYHFWP